MTPVEKCKSLIEQYAPLVTVWDCYHDAPRNYDDIIKDAKQCAIICVEQIIEQIDTMIDITGSSFVGSKLNYWQEVLNHLKNHNP